MGGTALFAQNPEILIRFKTKKSPSPKNPKNKANLLWEKPQFSAKKQPQNRGPGGPGGVPGGSPGGPKIPKIYPNLHELFLTLLDQKLFRYPIERKKPKKMPKKKVSKLHRKIHFLVGPRPPTPPSPPPPRPPRN